MKSNSPPPRKDVHALEREIAAVFDVSTTSEAIRVALRERVRKLKEKMGDGAAALRRLAARTPMYDSNSGAVGRVLVLVLLVLAPSATSLAAEHVLRGGTRAHLRSTDTAVLGRFTFRHDRDLVTLPDPRCPALSSLRLVWSASDVQQIGLSCEYWRSTANGFIYSAAIGAAGRIKLVVSGNRLIGRLLLPGAHGTGVDAPVRYLEVALTVGPESYCGRFRQVLPPSAAGFFAGGPSGACFSARPNILVVLLDDVRFDGIDRMPVVMNRIAAEGVSFDNAFTPQSSCLSSRASILTGLYPLRHGALQVSGPIGGAHTFREHGDDQQTIAVWLRDVGYRTGLFGKYLNDYGKTEEKQGPGGSFYTPPGWDRWWAFAYVEHYGGVLGTSYQIVEEDHLLSSYTDHATDAQYSTDLSAVELRAFMTDTVEAGQRFFAYWAPYAAHGETPGISAAPAQRHAGRFQSLTRWRPPSWGEPDISDKPRWVKRIQANETFVLAAVTDSIRQRQYEALLSADEQLGLILQHLQDLAIDEDTLILFTSDNGLGWGEHHVWGSKGCPYEECQRVPMMVRYPRRLSTQPRNVEAPALNNDIAPTLASFAGAALPYTPDGESLGAWLTGTPPTIWRNDYVLSNWRLARSDGLTYAGQVQDGDRIRIFYGDTRAQPRSSVVFEFDAGNGVSTGAVAVPIGANADESFSALSNAVQQSIPGVRATVVASQHSVGITPPLDDARTSIYVWDEVDQGGVIAASYPMPDFLGVRDVENGLTWVEYETGERELYDLAIDPAQLQNRADDPAYASTRQQLQDRLAQLLAEIAAR